MVSFAARCRPPLSSAVSGLIGRQPVDFLCYDFVAYFVLHSLPEPHGWRLPENLLRGRLMCACMFGESALGLRLGLRPSPLCPRPPLTNAPLAETLLAWIPILLDRLFPWFSDTRVGEALWVISVPSRPKRRGSDQYPRMLRDGNFLTSLGPSLTVWLVLTLQPESASPLNAPE